VLSGFMTLGWAKAAEAEAGDSAEFGWWSRAVLHAVGALRM
jgi:hypothetical protein